MNIRFKDYNQMLDVCRNGKFTETEKDFLIINETEYIRIYKKSLTIFTYGFQELVQDWWDNDLLEIF